MSIFSRYNPVPIVLSPPYEEDGNRDSEGNLVEVNFPNQWGDFFTSFATSGWMGLAAESGIILNTPGFVELSGLIADSIYAQNYYTIDASGEVMDLYPGALSGIVYKAGSGELAASDTIIYDTSLQTLIFPSISPGKMLYIGEENELSSYEHIEFNDSTTIGEGEDAVTIPANVVFNVNNVEITGNIKIGPEIESYRGRVLTHMGSGEDITAKWQEPSFLPEGLAFRRYPKRPIVIQSGALVFYSQLPEWFESLEDVGGFTQEILEQEYEMSDTIAVINEDGDVQYCKFADMVRYITYDDEVETTQPEWQDLITGTTITDPIDGKEYQGLSLEICPSNTHSASVSGIGYAFSVKRGSFFEMYLASGDAAQARFNCQGTDVDEADSKFTFKPSTINTLSNRPELYTSFNSVAEDIDFNIYGKRTIKYDNYEPDLFDLTENGVPSGLIPSLKIDAYIPNAVSGIPSSGVIYDKYIDREKIQPTGWGFDESGRVMVNATGAYSYAAIASGVGTLESYANLTVSGISYSDYVMTREIYLLPEPNPDGTSEYVTNALLTINDKGRIISRKTTDNPTRPDAPTGLSVNGGSNEVSMSWSAPSSDGGRSISNYVIQFSADNGNEWTTLPLSPVLIERQSPTQTSATIVGLNILTPYIFRVAAQNSVGISDYTTPSDTVFVSADLPENPQNFTARRFFSQDLGGPSEINLSWEAGHNGGSVILGYYLEESEDGGVNWINYNSPENLITNTFETITGTDEDIAYLYRISAFNSQGQSSYTFLAVAARGVDQEDPEDPDDDPLGNWDFGKVLFTGGIC